ncbi:thioredoxin-like protein [Auriculariales sp. MPI-PUGE-AT-0066]|nr:thioredoxin-like protein [Auriculariales sp. MPI-PUGE-AT-0066]
MRPLRTQLYYDIGSPKSYVALELLLRYAPIWNLELELIPSLLGAIFQITGNSPPMVNPYKKAHGAIDMARGFAHTKVSGSVPAFFGTPEHNFLGCARFLRAVSQALGQEVLLATTLALYKQVWVNHVAPVAPEFFNCLVPAVFSEEQLKDLLAKSVTPENKAGLKADAEKMAQEHGTFGFPWIVVYTADGRKECFFGSDRMEDMAFVLGPDYKYMGPLPKQSRL